MKVITNNKGQGYDQRTKSQGIVNDKTNGWARWGNLQCRTLERSSMRIFISPKILMSGVGESGNELRTKKFWTLWKSDQGNYRWNPQRGILSDIV